jgi:hypothetical protein
VRSAWLSRWNVHLVDRELVDVVAAEHGDVTRARIAHEAEALHTASAVPRYQNSPRRICAGTTSMYSPNPLSRQLRFRCLMRLDDMYCVST